MWRKLWQWCKKVFNRLFGSKAVQSAPVNLTPLDYETVFLELLIKVDSGYTEQQSLEFLQRYDSLENWQNWLQNFGQHLLSCDSLNLDLADKLIDLQNNRCGELGVVAGKIGNQLLAKAAPPSQKFSVPPQPQSSPSIPIPANLNTLAGVLTLLKNNPKMVQQLARELKIDTANPEIILKEIEVRAWVQEGTLRRKQGKLADAIAAFDQAVQLKSDYALLWAVRGNALFDAKQYEQAIASYDQALQLQPNDGETHYNRATALFHLKRYPETITATDSAINIDPSLPRIWTIRGLAYLQAQDYPQAIASFQQALTLDPNDTSAQTGLATAQRQQEPPPASHTL